MTQPKHNIDRGSDPERIVHLTARRRNRGAALVMVTVAVALATAMAAALLAANALRARAASNATDAATAQYLAESAANVAMYYLQYPDRYTGDKPKGYYEGEAPVDLGAGFEGAVESVVAYDDDEDEYLITTTSSLPRGSITYTKTIEATARIIPPPPPEYETIVDALLANADITLRPAMIVDGNVKTLGNVNVPGGSIIGKVASDTVSTSGGGSIGGLVRTLARALVELDSDGGLIDPEIVRDEFTDLVPPFNSIHDFRTYPALNLLLIWVNTTGPKLSSTSYNNVTMGATVLPLNPAGVYWHDSDVTFNGNSTINGTLILRNGAKLKVAAGSTLSVNATSGFPAILVSGPIELENGAVLHADGLVFADSVTMNPPTGATVMTVKGSMLLTSKTQPLPTAGSFTLAIQYNQTKAQSPGIETVRSPAFARGVKLLAWSE